MEGSGGGRFLFNHDSLWLWVPACAGTTPLFLASTARRQKQKARAESPGFSRDAENAARSGGGLEQLRRIGLDRLDGLARDLLAQFGDLLGLQGEGLLLLAPIIGSQSHRR